MRLEPRYIENLYISTHFFFGMHELVRNKGKCMYICNECELVSFLSIIHINESVSKKCLKINHVKV